MDWGFIWIMLVLKIPVFALLWLVWWSVRQTDDEPGEEESGGDGGTKRPRHPRPKRPSPPRTRGPHDGRRAPAPARVRTSACARDRVSVPRRPLRTP
ncbi:hypothetical protein [Conexibacter sp. SYSU D00693]|uniref:hypothetical protein n=1 Tax=Conexibacter sp. SYSU D00693 TaxID=2812560 RepID=UPI00196B55BB|nr:hypothetical protein [Conexibacter sp. SYSU D00693]